MKKAISILLSLVLALSVFAAIPLSKVQEQATEVLLEYVKMDFRRWILFL